MRWRYTTWIRRDGAEREATVARHGDDCVVELAHLFFNASASDLLTSIWNGRETIRSGEAVARCGCASVFIKLRRGLVASTATNRWAQETLWVIPETQPLRKRWRLLSITHKFANRAQE